MGSGKRTVGRRHGQAPRERRKIGKTPDEARLAQGIKDLRGTPAIHVEFVEIEKKSSDPPQRFPAVAQHRLLAALDIELEQVDGLGFEKALQAHARHRRPHSRESGREILDRPRVGALAAELDRSVPGPDGGLDDLHIRTTVPAQISSKHFGNRRVGLERGDPRFAVTPFEKETREADVGAAIENARAFSPKLHLERLPHKKVVPLRAYAEKVSVLEVVIQQANPPSNETRYPFRRSFRFVPGSDLALREQSPLGAAGEPPAASIELTEFLQNGRTRTESTSEPPADTTKHSTSGGGRVSIQAWWAGFPRESERPSGDGRSRAARRKARADPRPRRQYPCSKLSETPRHHVLQTPDAPPHLAAVVLRASRKVPSEVDAFPLPSRARVFIDSHCGQKDRFDG